MYQEFRDLFRGPRLWWVNFIRGIIPCKAPSDLPALPLPFWSRHLRICYDLHVFNWKLLLSYSHWNCYHFLRWTRTNWTKWCQWCDGKLKSKVILCESHLACCLLKSHLSIIYLVVNRLTLIPGETKLYNLIYKVFGGEVTT